MTASALNIAANTSAGPTGPQGVGPLAAAQAAGKATGPLAGFEALLAALFPQGGMMAADAPAGATGPAGVVPGKVADAANGGSGKGGKGTADPASDGAATSTTETRADGLVCDASAALAASLVATPAAAAAPPAPTTTASTSDLLDGARKLTPLAGHDTPRFDLLAEAEDAGVAGAEPLTEPKGGKSDLAAALGRGPGLQAAGDDTAKTPPAWGRAKEPGGPAAPALANAAARADARAEAGAGDVPTGPAAPTGAAADAAQSAPQALAAAAAPAAAPSRNEAPSASKGGRTERGKSAPEAAPVGDARPAVAADRPLTAKAVSAVAKAPDGDPDARPTSAEAHPADAASSDTNTSAPPSDTRTAAPDTASPMATSAHAVRGAPETVANLAAQIVKKLESKSTRFDVELDPAGLGKVNVRVEIGAHGALTAAMSFDNPQAAAELKSRAAELQRTLEQAGFDLSGGLSFDVADQRSGGQQQQQQAWQTFDGGEAGRSMRGLAFRSALDAADEAATAAASGALRLRRGVTAGLDVRI